jgi:hypothetical protein
MKLQLKGFLLAVLLIFSVCLACGCSDYSRPNEDTEFYGGDLLTPEDVQSIVDAVSEAHTEKYSTETDENGEQIVFWTEGGKVWHVSYHCPTVKRATGVIQGSEDEALAAGKTRPCSICSENE